MDAVALRNQLAKKLPKRLVSVSLMAGPGAGLKGFSMLNRNAPSLDKHKPKTRSTGGVCILYAHSILRIEPPWHNSGA